MNKAIIIGNIGNDIELKHTTSEKPVCNFSVATSMKIKKADGSFDSKTEWHNIVCWNKTAELVSQYTKKGSKIAVEGRLSTREWTDKNEVKRYTTEIVANNIEFLDKKEAASPAPAPDAEAVDDIPF